MVSAVLSRAIVASSFSSNYCNVSRCSVYIPCDSHKYLECSVGLNSFPADYSCELLFVWLCFYPSSHLDLSIPVYKCVSSTDLSLFCISNIPFNKTMISFSKDTGDTKVLSKNSFGISPV